MARQLRPALAIALIASLVALPSRAVASSFSAGAQQTIVTAQQRGPLGLKWWPDGPLGVEKTLTGYTFNAPNGPNVARSIGTLDNPVASGVTPSIEVTGARALTDVGYASGGPVYRAQVGGTRLMFVHLERYPTADPKVWYGSVGLAKSTDGGQSWHFLGEILTSPLSYSDYKTAFPCGAIAPSSFGQYVIRQVDGVNYFYVYGANVDAAPGCHIGLGVARAPVSDVVAAAKNDTTSPWSNYLAGAWTEPGLGGEASDIWPYQQRAFAVSYNSYLDRFIMLMPSQGVTGRYSLDVSESPDGVTWSAPVQLFTSATEIYAPTIVGTGRNPSVSGEHFYAYYTSSALALTTGFRWDDGTLCRRTITVGQL